jgi:hypothetical protein
LLTLACENSSSAIKISSPFSMKVPTYRPIVSTCKKLKVMQHFSSSSTKGNGWLKKGKSIWLTSITKNAKQWNSISTRLIRRSVAPLELINSRSCFYQLASPKQEKKLKLWLTQSMKTNREKYNLESFCQWSKMMRAKTKKLYHFSSLF